MVGTGAELGANPSSWLTVLVDGQNEGPASWNGLRLEGLLELHELTLANACQDTYGGEYGALLVTDGEVSGSNLFVEGCPETGIRTNDDSAPMQLDRVEVVGAALPAHLTFDQAGGLTGVVALAEAPVELWGTYLETDAVLPALRYRTTVWDGIEIRNGGGPATSVLEYVVIADAGGRPGNVEYTQAAIHIDGGSATLSNVTVQGHAGFGLSIEQEFVEGSLVQDTKTSCT